MKRIFTFSLVFSWLVFFTFPELAAQQMIAPEKVVSPAYFDLTRPLRDMPLIKPGIRDRQWKDQIVKNHFGFMEDVNNMQLPTGPDPVLQKEQGEKSSRAINQNFEGISNLNGVAPSDTDGDIGPNHYFQVVNLSFAIFDKDGNLIYGPADNKTIWDGFIGPWTGTNDGDPVVLYDEAADRWMMSQFAIYTTNGTQWELVAVSQTGDPTGAWYRYAFQFTYMPDYPKLGIWRDGYYLSVNQFEKVGTNYNWKGGGACVLNRTKMLAGDPTAEMVFFNLGTMHGGLLPADVDGDLPPAGTPGFFSRFSSGSLQLWSLAANWSNPSSSVIQSLPEIPVASFSNSGINITQPGTGQTLATIGDRLMYRLQYRNFGNYQAMVTNHTVNNGSGTAAIRWYELRKSGGNWQLYQQGTFAPADGNHRWMGSIAMNQTGDIALGYSVSGNNRYPSICYTGRSNSDEPGLMTWAETTILEGTQSQTGLSRWGDYSCMSVDPSNDLDFWFTTEYTSGGWNWRTRIASFSPFVPLLPQISVDPLVLDFGNSVPGNPVSLPISIQNIGNVQLTVSDIFSDNNDFTVNPGSAIIDPESRTEVIVTFSPGSAGLISGNLTIFSDDPNYPQVVVTVSGTGVLTPPQNLQASVTGYDVTLTWQPPQTSAKSLLGYQIYRQGVLINPEPVVSTFFTETNVPGGDWQFQAAAVYEEGLSELTPPVLAAVGDPQIQTNVNSFTEIVVRGDSLSKDLIIRNIGYQPLNFGLEIGFELKGSENPDVDYCIPTSNCASGRRFDIFSFGNILNSSSGCSPSGYGDFTGMTTDVEAGQTYSANFKGGISKLNVCLWIDFDNNGSFEDDEMIIKDLYLKYSSVTYTENITLPTFLSSGPKRLRIRCNYNTSAADPCRDFTYGETEDYTINLIGGQTSWLTTNPDAGSIPPGDSASINLEFNASQLEKGVYDSKIMINSNDPVFPILELPATMDVINVLSRFEASNTDILTSDHIDFIDQSIGNISSWLWQFEGGTPSSSTVPNPSGIVYTNSGIFDVSLSVSNGTDTSLLLKNNYITVSPRDTLHADFFSDTTMVYEGGSVHFFNNSTGNPTFFKWTIPGGTPEIIYTQNPVIFFYSPGIYDVTLYISADSMNDQITKHEYIEVLEVVSTLPPGWEFTTTTRQHILAVPLESNPRIINTLLQPGDYIGVFYTNSFGQKVCGGAELWNGGEAIVVVAQGDDPATPFKDGFSIGEAFEWRLYSWDRGRDFVAVPQYNPLLLSTGVFFPMAMSALLDIYAGMTFELVIPQGWSGISSPVDPWYPDPNELFEPVIENLVILYNNSGIFWPSNNINTLGTWNNLSGYVTKFGQPDTLIIEGYKEIILTRAVVQGWNFLPIPVLCEKNVVDLFASNLSKFVMIREVAGYKMYWPQHGINTLGVVKPGKAYQVYANQAFNVQFTACTNSLLNPVVEENDFSIQNNPWQFSGFTGTVHSVALLPEAANHFLRGDVLGAFDNAGNCFGIAGFDGQPIAISMFGDDPTTPEKDGFSENENMNFRIYRPENQAIFELTPVFDPSMPQQSNFTINGLSAITDVKISANSTSKIAREEIAIFPNPGEGKFRVSGMKHVKNIIILDLHGKEILTIQNDGCENLPFDISGHKPGVYFARFIFEDQMVVKRVIVK